MHALALPAGLPEAEYERLDGHLKEVILKRGYVMREAAVNEPGRGTITILDRGKMEAQA